MLTSYCRGVYRRGTIDEHGDFHAESEKEIIVQAFLSESRTMTNEEGETVSSLTLGRVNPSTLQVKENADGGRNVGFWAKASSIQHIRPIVLEDMDGEEAQAFDRLPVVLEELAAKGQKWLKSGDELKKNWRINTNTGELFWYRRDTSKGEDAYHEYSILTSDLIYLYTSLKQFGSEAEVKAEIANLASSMQSSIPKRTNKRLIKVF